MKEQIKNLSFLENILIYFSKILLIYRTRNVYGYNSMSMRIFHHVAGSRRQKRLRTRRMTLQY
jgi:hypothetical protein